MKIILLASSIMVFLFILTGGALALVNQDTYVIGGEYVVREGEIVRGNLNLVFAQVTLEDGSKIEGGLLAISSCVDVRGSVAGSISSVESDIKLEKSASVRDLHQDKGVIPFVILLPKMARWNLAFGR
jgi:hypothetical protein